MLPAMMILALLAAASVSPADPPRLQVFEQARASVRIVRGERITARSIPRDAIVRVTQIRAADGIYSPARLVEFP